MKFHLNPNTGNVSVCSASVVERCPFYNVDDNSNHYKSEKSAVKDMEKRFSNKFGFFGVSKFSPEKHAMKVNELFDVVNNIEDGSAFKDIVKTVDLKKTNFKVLNDVINLRIINYNSTESSQDKNARLVEIFENSRFYTKFYETKSFDSLGYCDKVYANKYGDAVYNDTVSATDVGKLVMYDYWEGDKPQWLKNNFENLVEKRKKQRTAWEPNDEEMDSKYFDRNGRRGATYRGNVWEGQLRNSFAEDNPEYTVYDSAGEYRRIDEPWIVGKFDGVLSDREDGKPNGILEIKTAKDESKWKNGVPNNYRAQTLYYLEMTGFEYAKVRVLINNNDNNQAEVRDYTIHRGEEIVPGSNTNMRQYIDKRIKPLFNISEYTKHNNYISSGNRKSWTV